jgi:hypothetical protein
MKGLASCPDCQGSGTKFGIRRLRHQRSISVSITCKRRLMATPHFKARLTPLPSTSEHTGMADAATPRPVTGPAHSRKGLK